MVVRFCDDRRLLEKDFLGKQKGDLSSPDKMKAPFLFEFSPKTRFHFQVFGSEKETPSLSL